MKNHHLLTLLQENFTTVLVVFKGEANWKESKPYMYKALKSLELKVDDLVVVDSPSAGMVVVRVTEVHDCPKINLDHPATYKWIVQKVDRSAYDALLKQQEHFNDVMLEIERVKAREQLVNDFKRDLPENSKARQLFEGLLGEMSAPVIEHKA